MTTSYKLEAVKALKAQKKEARAQEELELKAAREAAETKAAPKKRGRPKKSS